MPGDINVNVSDAYLAGELFDDLLITPIEELDGWVAKRVGRAFCRGRLSLDRIRQLRARAGDTISFDCTQPHRFATIGDETAEAVWFVVGRRNTLSIDDASVGP